MIEGFTLGNYPLLVESTGRLFRAGKASISGELAGVFSRLGIDAESWSVRLLKLGGGRLLGRFFSREPAQVARDGRTTGAASPGEPGGLPGRLISAPCLAKSGRSLSLPPRVSGPSSGTMSLFEVPGPENSWRQERYVGDLLELRFRRLTSGVAVQLPVSRHPGAAALSTSPSAVRVRLRLLQAHLSASDCGFRGRRPRA